MFKQIKNLLQSIKKGYQRAVYEVDEEMWNHPDEYMAIFIQARVTTKLEELDFDEKQAPMLEQIAFGMGSYIEMCSGCYCKREAEFKRLEKEYKKAMKLLTDNYDTIWK